jgi:hypothetical protein
VLSIFRLENSSRNKPVPAESNRLIRLLPHLLVGLACCLLSQCGGGFSTVLPPGSPAKPTPSDPWYGAAGNVLVQESDSPPIYTWIGFNSQVSWQHYLAMVQQAKQMGGVTWIWMGGPVIVNSHNPLGFYFDPNKSDAEIVTPKVVQTSLFWIEQDPVCYSQNYSPGFPWYAPVAPIFPQTLSNMSGQSSARAAAPPSDLCPGQ